MKSQTHEHEYEFIYVALVSVMLTHFASANPSTRNVELITSVSVYNASYVTP